MPDRIGKCREYKRICSLIAPRSSLGITLSVWRALILREALTRLFKQRAAWFWLLVEPLAHVALLSFIFAVIRQRTVGNMETILWIVLGLLGYFTFRRTALQTSQAIASNEALFAFRQVTPVDTVIARAILELALIAVLFAIALTAVALFGVDVTPYNAIEAVLAICGLWAFGLSIGLISSSFSEVAPEFSNVLNVLMMPLYFVSGVLLPLVHIPEPYRSYLMYNPIANGLEGAREAFSPLYHAAPGTSVGYLYFVSLCLIVFGLLSHSHFRKVILAQ